MTHRTYSAYKDSGIEWLRDVPEHWEVKHFRRVVDITEGQVDPEKEPYSTMNLIAPNHIESGTGRLSGMETASEQSAESGKYLCKAGDVIYSKIRPALRKACVAPVDCLCSADMYPLSGKRGLSNPYLFWMILSEEFSALTILESDRVAMPKVNRDSLNGMYLLLPPLPEQQAIAAFLDRETAKIDGLVAEQERLIELLTEKRQALISHAVTRGLDPSAPLKESGVEWLGKVPEHWDVCALNYRYEIALGKMLDEKKITGNHLAPYLRNIDVQWGVINTDSLPEMDFSGDDLVRYSLQKGDLLVCEGGDVGRAALWLGQLEECFYQKALHRLRARREQADTATYLFYALMVAAKLGVFSEGKSTIAHLTAESFRRYSFCFPPLPEQQAIAANLDEQTAQFDTLPPVSVKMSPSTH